MALRLNALLYCDQTQRLNAIVFALNVVRLRLNNIFCVETQHTLRFNAQLRFKAKTIAIDRNRYLFLY